MDNRTLQMLTNKNTSPRTIWVWLQEKSPNNEFYDTMVEFYINRCIQEKCLGNMNVNNYMLEWFANNKEYYKLILKKLKKQIITTNPEYSFFNTIISSIEIGLHYLPYVLEFVEKPNNVYYFMHSVIKMNIGTEVLDSPYIYDYYKLDNKIQEYARIRRAESLFKTFQHLMSKENEEYLFELITDWDIVKLEWFNYTYEEAKKRIFLNRLTGE